MLRQFVPLLRFAVRCRSITIPNEFPDLIYIDENGPLTHPYRPCGSGLASATGARPSESMSTRRQSGDGSYLQMNDTPSFALPPPSPHGESHANDVCSAVPAGVI